MPSEWSRLWTVITSYSIHYTKLYETSGGVSYSAKDGMQIGSDAKC